MKKNNNETSQKNCFPNKDHEACKNCAILKNPGLHSACLSCHKVSSSPIKMQNAVELYSKLMSEHEEKIRKMQEQEREDAIDRAKYIFNIISAGYPYKTKVRKEPEPTESNPAEAYIKQRREMALAAISILN